jgi:hypothetical protein
MRFLLTPVAMCFVLSICSSAEDAPQEAPIRGRKESRARVFLDQNAAMLREVARQMEAPLDRGNEKSLNFAKIRSEIRTLRIVTDDAPAAEELPAGFTTDFDAFKRGLPASTVFEGDDGTVFLSPTEGATPVSYYTVEEDLALNELELTVFHGQMLQLAQVAAKSRVGQLPFPTSFTSADPAASPFVQTPLRSQTEQNRVVRWVPGSTLTYCVLKWSFGSNEQYELVKSNMHKACEDWEKTCNIKFQHIESLDLVPRGTTFPLDANGKRKVLFIVANIDIGTTIARAFFPNDALSKRLLLVDPDEYFETEIDKVGVLRHELGHVLGFRHEHISPNAPAWSSAFCSLEPPTNSTEVSGGYDRASVMHYPCTAKLKGGPLRENMKLEITNLDIIGAQAVYGAPGGQPTGNFRFRDFDSAP